MEKGFISKPEDALRRIRLQISSPKIANMNQTSLTTRDLGRSIRRYGNTRRSNIPNDDRSNVLQNHGEIRNGDDSHEFCPLCLYPEQACYLPCIRILMKIVKKTKYILRDSLGLR